MPCAVCVCVCVCVHAHLELCAQIARENLQRRCSVRRVVVIVVEDVIPQLQIEALVGRELRQPRVVLVLLLLLSHLQESA